MFRTYNPFVELSRLHNDFVRDLAHNRQESFEPAIDIFEDKEAVFLALEVPGVRQEDIHLNVENNVLTVSGERNFERTENAGSSFRTERKYGSFSRSFALPPAVNGDSIEATLDHGVLTVRIAKRDLASTRRIPIQTRSNKPADSLKKEPSPIEATPPRN